MSEAQLSVPEMTCDACRMAVAGALDELPGVQEVHVDLESKLVTVRHEGQLGVEAMAAAVEDQGYRVQGAREGGA